MPQRDIDNYGYRDGNYEKPDFRGSQEVSRSTNDIGELSTYAGVSLEASNPVKLTETSVKLSIGEIINGEDSATKCCVKVSVDISTPEPEIDEEFTKIKENLSKLVATKNIIDIRKINEKAEDSASVEFKIEGEANTFITTKSVEGSVKFSTNQETDYNWKPDYTVGDKIGIGAKVSIEGCMTFKNRDTNSWDLINKW